MSRPILFDPISATQSQWDSFLPLFARLSKHPYDQQEIIAQHQRRKDLYALLNEAIVYGHPKVSTTGEPVWQIEVFHERSVYDPAWIKNVQDGLDLLLPMGASFVCTTNDGLLEKMLVELGSTRINALNYYRLQKRNFHVPLVGARPDGLRLEVHEFMPEGYYKAFARLMTISMNDIVRENTWELFQETEEGLADKINQFKANGSIMLVGLLMTPSGELAGQSVIVVPAGGSLANQHITGIAPAFRGKGWATYLKASLTAEAFNRFNWVECLGTNCYQANKAIIQVNLQLGYKLIETKFQYWGRLG